MNGHLPSTSIFTGLTEIGNKKIIDTFWRELFE